MRGRGGREYAANCTRHKPTTVRRKPTAAHRPCPSPAHDKVDGIAHAHQVPAASMSHTRTHTYAHTRTHTNSHTHARAHSPRLSCTTITAPRLSYIHHDIHIMHLGLSCGSSSQHSFTTRQNAPFSSPPDRPPMAYPGKLRCTWLTCHWHATATAGGRGDATSCAVQ